jgi:hypothetical protein
MSATLPDDMLALITKELGNVEVAGGTVGAENEQEQELLSVPPFSPRSCTTEVEDVPVGQGYPSPPLASPIVSKTDKALDDAAMAGFDLELRASTVGHMWNKANQYDPQLLEDYTECNNIHRST